MSNEDLDRKYLIAFLPQIVYIYNLGYANGSSLNIGIDIRLFQKY